MTGTRQALLKDKDLRYATKQDASPPFVGVLSFSLLTWVSLSRWRLDKEGHPIDVRWLPVPLRPWFWIPFVIILVLAAIGLEVALHFSNKNQGERLGPKKFLFFSTVEQDGSQMVVLEIRRVLYIMSMCVWALHLPYFPDVCSLIRRCLLWLLPQLWVLLW